MRGVPGSSADGRVVRSESIPRIARGGATLFTVVKVAAIRLASFEASEDSSKRDPDMSGSLVASPMRWCVTWSVPGTTATGRVVLRSDRCIPRIGARAAPRRSRSRRWRCDHSRGSQCFGAISGFRASRRRYDAHAFARVEGLPRARLVRPSAHEAAQVAIIVKQKAAAAAPAVHRTRGRCCLRQRLHLSQVAHPYTSHFVDDTPHITQDALTRCAQHVALPYQRTSPTRTA